MNEKPEKLIDKKGIRSDGRKADELRPLRLQVGVLSNADGSAYIEHGKNKILAAAFGQERCILNTWLSQTAWFCGAVITWLPFQYRNANHPRLREEKLNFQKS